MWALVAKPWLVDDCSYCPIPCRWSSSMGIAKTGGHWTLLIWLRFTISGTGEWWVSPFLHPFVDDIPWKVTQCMNSGFKVMELVAVRPAAKNLRQPVRGDASANSGLCQLQITKALVHFGDVWFDSRLYTHISCLFDQACLSGLDMTSWMKNASPLGMWHPRTWKLTRDPRVI